MDILMVVKGAVQFAEALGSKDTVLLVDDEFGRNY